MQFEGNDITINGINTRYYEAGQPHKRAMLLLHGGFGAAQLHWSGVLEHFYEYYVIAPDLPGYGGSAPLPSMRIADLVTWAHDLLEALGLDDGRDAGRPADQVLIQGCLLILQALFIDIEDLLGSKQANLFESDMANSLMQWRFPQVGSKKAVSNLLTIDPLATQVPPWEEHHLQRLLEEMHRLGKEAFGNANFTQRSLEAIEDLSNQEQQTFMSWLSMSPSGKLWR